MLQRAFLAQKRYLEWIFARYKLLACRSYSSNPTAVLARRPQDPFAISHSAEPAIDRTISSTGYLTSTHSHQSKNQAGAPIAAICSGIPLIFHPILERLVSGHRPDNILPYIKKSPGLMALFSDGRKIRNVIISVAQSPTPQHSLQIFALAHDLGHTLKQTAYEATCFHLATSKKWTVILEIIASSKEQVGYTSGRLLNWRARALLECEEFSLLRGILTEFQAAGISPNQRTYHLILSGYIRNHDREGIKQHLRCMQEAGISVDGTTHALLSRSYRNTGVDPEVNRNALKSLPDLLPDERVAVVNSLLQSSLDKRDISRALQILSLFETDAVQDLCSLISSYQDSATASFNSSSLEIATPPGMGLIPTVATVVVVMNFGIKNSSYSAVIQLWERRASAGLSATQHVITSLVHAYFLQGQGDTAIRMLAAISPQPCVNEFHSLLMGTKDGGGFPPLNISRPSLTIRICNALLRGSLRQRGFDSVPPIFSIMHANELRPNARTLEILMAHINRSEEALPRTLFQLLRAFSSPTLRPSMRHLHHIISSVYRQEKRPILCSAWIPKNRISTSNEHRRLVRLLLAPEGPFDPTAGIELSRHLSYRRFAAPFIQSLKSRGVKPDDALVFSRIKRDAALHLDLGSANSVFHASVVRGMYPNWHHFAALMEGYALSGDSASALAVMNAAERAGVKPNAVMYTTLVASHARQGDAASAMHMFKQMVLAGIPPDVPAIDALVSAFYNAHQHDKARQLLRSLWTYIQPFPEDMQLANLETMISKFRSLAPYRSKGVKFKIPRRYLIHHHLRRWIRAYRLHFGGSGKRRQSPWWSN